MKTLAPLVCLLAGVAHAQPQSGPATAGGTCSAANTGNNNTFTITCGIGKQQGDTILQIVNKILADQGVSLQEFDAKLDEILRTIKKLPTLRDFDVQQFRQKLMDIGRDNYAGPHVVTTIDADSLSPFVMKVSQAFMVDPNLVNNGTYNNSLTIQFGDGSSKQFAEAVRSTFAAFGIMATIESFPALGPSRIRIKIASQM